MQAQKFVAEQVSAHPVNRLPLLAPYPVASDFPWYKFPVGVREDESIVTWDSRQSAHGLVVGQAGAGKTMLLQGMLQHCSKNSDHWDVYLLNLYGSDRLLSQNSHVIKRSALTLEDIEETLQDIHLQMGQRFEQMRQEGLRMFSGKHTLVLIEEASAIMEPELSSTPENSAKNALRHSIFELITSLCRKGRAAGIHLVISTQHPGTKVMSAEIKANLGTVFVLGKASHVASYAALGTNTATSLSLNAQGRAVISQHGEKEIFQSFLLA